MLLGHLKVTLLQLLFEALQLPLVPFLPFLEISIVPLELVVVEAQ